MPGWICWTAIAAAAFAVPVAWAALTRTLRPPASIRGEPRDSPVQAFREADGRARVEVIGSFLSFGFAIATIALKLTVSGKVTAHELICVYIAGGIFEIIGILVTIDALIDTGQGMSFTPERWAKWRGPAFIITGIVLGFIGNVESIYVGKV